MYKMELHKRLLMNKQDIVDEKKSTTIKLAIENYQYLKEVGKINNRSITGQVNWVCRVASTLQEDHPEIYAQISHKLNRLG